MNKKLLFSYLLGLSICGSFSLHGMNEEINPDGSYSVEYSDSDNEQDHVQFAQTLPVLAQCLVDENGNVIKVLNVKRLGRDEITEIYNLLGQDYEELTAEQALTLFLSGSTKILEGACIAVIVGGRFIAPHAKNFGAQVWNYLSESFDKFVGLNDEEDAFDNPWPIR